MLNNGLYCTFNIRKLLLLLRLRLLPYATVLSTLRRVPGSDSDTLEKGSDDVFAQSVEDTALVDLMMKLLPAVLLPPPPPTHPHTPHSLTTQRSNQ